MTAPSPASPSSGEIAATLRRLSPAYAPTPLLDLPRLAARLGVARVMAKDEGQRMLGSFKSLGGTYAGLRALARHAGGTVEALLARRPPDLPALVCASDGNHGLAVATAAAMAGGPARIYLHATVDPARAARIEAAGAEVVWVRGTYDDAVDEAARAAEAGAGILIADTSADPDDPVVGDVMAGYGVIAAEARAQIEAAGLPRPTHLFIQAGVGGLAAAMAEGLAGWMDPPAAVVVAEPASACCIAPALEAGRVVRIAGDLETAAAMLSCGEASAPALAILRRHAATVVAVSEEALIEAPRLLAACGGPASTASGAAGIAGAMTAAADPASRQALRLTAESRVLFVVSETDHTFVSGG
ncbi:MAG: pyridoxal-phosphate dependent enzyme [Proteobacteria bacterium]|nr:pyridoxal-phosphate dependent enzyme [Pseudomonadota bacterium]